MLKNAENHMNDELNDKLSNKWKEILEYLNINYHNLNTSNINTSNINTYIPNIYSSIDIRQSSFKITPVDVNLFPAGFNNFENNDNIMDMAVKYFSKYIYNYLNYRNQLNDTKIKIEKILVIIDNITRNQNYIKNVQMLKKILENANFEVKLGYIKTNNLTNEDEIVLSTFAEKVIKQNSIVLVESNFTPDLVLLNNDLTIELPEELKDISQINQIILPKVESGWYNRSKYKFFEYYNSIVKDISSVINIDPWLISTYHTIVNNVNFQDKIGMEDIAIKVDLILSEIKKKYLEYNIKEEPYVFIKSDNGTQGMGIITAKNGDDIRQLNKKTRHSMSKIKYGRKNTDVLIQEGVNTNILYDKQYPAEKFIYIIGDDILGVLLRYNIKKNYTANLNSSGMAIVTCNEQKCTKTEELITMICNIAANMSV